MKHFSEIPAAARPVPPLRCHSDAPTQLCCQRRIFALESSSRSFSRKTVFIPSAESSDYDCGHGMKRKDSSSQAPQNDKEKRRRTGFGLNEESFQENRTKSRLFHVKHSSEKSAAVRFIPPSRCHSERQRRIFALDLQAVV